MSHKHNRANISLTVPTDRNPTRPTDRPDRPTHRILKQTQPVYYEQPSYYQPSYQPSYQQSYGGSSYGGSSYGGSHY